MGAGPFGVELSGAPELHRDVLQADSIPRRVTTLTSDSRDVTVPPDNSAAPGIDRRGAMRSLTESLISLFIAVLLFRTFAAEGYMISTGSMAPCLLGFHKRVECPRCGRLFAFGVAYDTDSDEEADELQRSRSRAVCPNCGQGGIDVSKVPRNHGDQLLVNKQAYLYDVPDRWEIIVFRNPAKATEAYVKRVVGLPGERLQLSDGDVFINDRRVQKDYEQQLAMRILVHDHDYQPVDDPAYQPHWQPEFPSPGDDSPSAGAWKVDGAGFLLRAGNERRPDHEPFRWVGYRHWIRSSGLHDTAVPLAKWDNEIDRAEVPPVGLRYDQRAGTLSCTGALSAVALKKILTLSHDQDFHAAMRKLYEESHVVPLNDEYGYNPADDGGIPNQVRDVMVSCRVHLERGHGEFAIQMSDGAKNYACVLNASRHEVQLLIGDSTEPVTTSPWPASLDNQPADIEMSLIDQQVIFAINGQLALPAWPIETPEGLPAPRCAVRIGARGLDVHVDQLKLYRDVYYTSARSRNGVNQPLTLQAEEYFVLGDNSPISLDSRRWDKAPVHRSLLLGKPFLVHLPSKPGRLKVGSYEMHLRLPDMSRIRFLK